MKNRYLMYFVIAGIFLGCFSSALIHNVIAYECNIYPEMDNGKQYWYVSLGSADHYFYVDDRPVHDGDNTYVNTSKKSVTDSFIMFDLQYGFGEIPDEHLTNISINFIELHDTSKKIGTTAGIRMTLSPNIEQNPLQLPPLLTTSYVNHTLTITDVYYTEGENEYWRNLTLDDVNDLTLTISSMWLSGTTNIRCTQVYCLVNWSYLPEVIEEQHYEQFLIFSPFGLIGFYAIILNRRKKHDI